MKKPLVISVSAISGGGKTALCAALLEKLPNSGLISFDDYPDMLPRDFVEWALDTNDYNEWQLEPLARDIEGLFADALDYLILDYPFGRCNTLVSEYIDFAVWVDTPLDVAMARRVLRDYTRRSGERNFIPDLFGNLDNEMAGYLTHGREIYLRCTDTVPRSCDMTLSGMRPVGELADAVVRETTRQR